MMFSNLKPSLYFELKCMSQSCYYAVSSNWKCWKFMFNDSIGLAIFKHIDFTEGDLWSAVAIRKEGYEYFPLDDVWLNIFTSQLRQYAELIKELFI